MKLMIVDLVLLNMVSIKNHNRFENFFPIKASHQTMINILNSILTNFTSIEENLIQKINNEPKIKTDKDVSLILGIKGILLFNIPIHCCSILL